MRFFANIYKKHYLWQILYYFFPSLKPLVNASPTKQRDHLISLTDLANSSLSKANIFQEWYPERWINSQKCSLNKKL